VLVFLIYRVLVLKKIKEEDSFEKVGVDGRVILKWTLKNYDSSVECWVHMRTGTIGVLL
jgi:hypothetical protein